MFTLTVPIGKDLIFAIIPLCWKPKKVTTHSRKSFLQPCKKTASKHFFSYNGSKKNRVTFTLRNERLDLKITRWFAVHYPIFRISIFIKRLLSLLGFFHALFWNSYKIIGKTVFALYQKTSYPYWGEFIVPVLI